MNGSSSTGPDLEGLRGSPPGRAPDLLTALATCSFVVAALYFGSELFVPLALAVMLGFVLTPLVLKLRSWDVGRSTSVILVVTLAFLIIFGLGVVLTRQVSELAESLPKYETTFRQKLKALRPAPQTGGAIDRATDAFRNLAQELRSAPQPPAQPEPKGPGASRTAAPPEPVPVEIREPPRRPLDYARDAAGALVHPLATTGLVLVFVVFILFQREDLRDRVIRLVGGNNLQRTTAAINDAAHRLSRYFLTYTVMNAAYGTFIGLALWLIGIPNPALWGILAGLMRFVPYVGSIIAGALPVILAAAVYPGWSTAVLTLALFVASEAAMGQLFEPLLLGRATGLSPLAAIVSLSFWAWLWGPIGLVLAIPLTVCLSVLGRHVEHLSFLYVLLGDEPALTPAQKFYQRLLTGDAAEIIYQAEECLKEASLLTYLDTIALPGLLLAQADANQGRLTPERLNEMQEVIEEVADELAQSAEGKASDKAEEQSEELSALPRLDAAMLRPEWRADGSVLSIGVRNALDRAAARLFAVLAEKHGIRSQIVGSQSVGPATLPSLNLKQAKMAVLSYLNAEAAPAYAKYLFRRLKRQQPDIAVTLGFWGGSSATTPDFAAEAFGGAKRAGSFREALSLVIAAATKEPNSETATASV